jgi:hypothetical protein
MAEPSENALNDSGDGVTQLAGASVLLWWTARLLQYVR